MELNVKTLTVPTMEEAHEYAADCEVLVEFGQQLGLIAEGEADWCCQEAAYSYFRCEKSTSNDLRVIEIKLSGKGLTGTVPSSIGNLKELEFFDASNNKLGIVLKIWMVVQEDIG